MPAGLGAHMKLQATAGEAGRARSSRNSSTVPVLETKPMASGSPAMRKDNPA
jgi:hypothetical protein